jgi:hypothetical protein
MLPKDKRQIASEVETVARHWRFLPGHLQTSILEIVSHYGPASKDTGFPSPPGAKWEDVEILLIDRDCVKVTVGKVSKRYTFQAIGLADKRRPERARSEWQMLKRYAENPQPDAYYKLPKRKSLKVEISQFRRWLKSFFGIPGDPLRPFRTGLWLPRFKISVDYAA